MNRSNLVVFINFCSPVCFKIPTTEPGIATYLRAGTSDPLLPSVTVIGLFPVLAGDAVVGLDVQFGPHSSGAGVKDEEQTPSLLRSRSDGLGPRFEDSLRVRAGDRQPKVDAVVVGSQGIVCSSHFDLLRIELVRPSVVCNRVLGEGDWLFRTQSGTPLNPRNVMRRQVLPVARKLKLTVGGFHSLRHSFNGGTAAAGHVSQGHLDDLGACLDCDDRQRLRSC